MKSIITIYRRELGSYFVSPIAYIVVGAFLVATGLFFNVYVRFAVDASTRQAMQGGPEQDIPSMVFRGFFGVVSTIILFVIPMLTMGVYAEERKRGTMELLMTSPVSEFQIVTAKFLGAFTLYLAMLAPTLLYHYMLGMHTEPGLPWRIVWSGYLGLILLGAFLVALGSFISSLTESQIIAGVATFVTFLLLLILNALTPESLTTWGEILGYLSILKHFEDFSRGIIDTSSVVFYLSMTALGIFLTLRTLDSMRWRRA